MTRLAYLDSAATTPVRPEVRAEMAPYFDERLFGNPSSGHRIGRDARAALEGARRRIAIALGADTATVVFTSGGTEADNLAVLGAAQRARIGGRVPRVAVAATEHKAVLDAAHAVERLGGEAFVLPVGGDGRLQLDAVHQVLDRELALLSVMWVNNETGVLQDIVALAARAEEAGTPLHTDAVQAIGKISCSLTQAPIAFLTISGHKIGAPKGIGALVVRDCQLLAPLLHGGGQQHGLRPGTENVAFAVGLATAVELAISETADCRRKTGTLRDRMEDAILTAIPGACVAAGAAERAPHISNVTFYGMDAGIALTQLDQHGIACSSGAACATGSPTPSHVLLAMGFPPALAASSLRFSLARQTPAGDVERVIEVLPAIVERSRAMAQRLGRV